jgi:prepilin-type processing-associated H-X9-DG protein
MIWLPGFTAHTNNKGTLYTFNMAFIDGHVSTVNDKILATYKTGKVFWPGQETATPISELYCLDDDLDILETEADGRDAYTANADPFLTRFDTFAGATDPYIAREQKTTSSQGPGVTSDHPAVPWL